MKLVRYTPTYNSPRNPLGILRPGRLDDDQVIDLVRTFAAPEDMTEMLSRLMQPAHAERWRQPIGRTLPLADVRELTAPMPGNSRYASNARAIVRRLSINRDFPVPETASRCQD